MAVGDLTTRETAKAYLRFDRFDDDEEIDRIVASASAWFTSQIQRDLTQTSQTDTFEWVPTRERPTNIRRFRLTRSPFVSAADSAVTVDGSPVTKWTQTPGVPLDAAPGWRIAGDFLELIGWQSLGASSVWNFSGIVPSSSLITRLVSVTYVGGYVTYDTDGKPSGVPADVEQAVIEIAGDMLKRRDRLGQRSRSVGGETVTYFVDAVPPNLVATIDRYKTALSIG